MLHVGASGGQKRALDPFELELEVVTIHPSGSWDPKWGLLQE